MNSDLPQIYLTQGDMDQLLQLVDAYPGRRFEQLERELLRARVVRPDGERREVTLVYPGSADIDAGKISVLTPVRTALLGLRVGQSMDWELPGGGRRRYRIAAVPYQPEAAGELH
jgi:hypothetical protein